MSRKCSTVVYC